MPYQPPTAPRPMLQLRESRKEVCVCLFRIHDSLFLSSAQTRYNPLFGVRYISWTIADVTLTEELASSIKSVAGKKKSEAHGSASELAGDAKGKASELAGEAKGTASEVTGKAKGKAEEVKGKL